MGLCPGWRHLLVVEFCQGMCPGFCPGMCPGFAQAYARGACALGFAQAYARGFANPGRKIPSKCLGQKNNPIWKSVKNLEKCPSFCQAKAQEFTLGFCWGICPKGVGLCLNGPFSNWGWCKSPWRMPWQMPGHFSRFLVSWHIASTFQLNIQTLPYNNYRQKPVHVYCPGICTGFLHHPSIIEWASSCKAVTKAKLQIKFC